MEVLSLFKPLIENRAKITYISIEKIKPNPYQPRKYFDIGSLDELAGSISQYGVLQPINVRKLGPFYELIAGERRLRAAKMAGLIEIPCIVSDYNDDDSAVIAIIENLQRQDLSFFEEAEGYNSLIFQHGLTQEQLATKLSKNQSTIANKLRLLKLSPMIKKIISDNNLTERHARALLRLLDEQLQLKALTEIVEKGLNVQESENLIERIIDKNLNSTNKRKNIRIFKDVRIFINTIKQAVDLMKKAGIDAKSQKNECDEYIEYIIKIPKTT